MFFSQNRVLVVRRQNASNDHKPGGKRVQIKEAAENGDLPNGLVSKTGQLCSKFRSLWDHFSLQLHEFKSFARKGTNNNEDTSELGDLSSDCGHQSDCITLKTRILPKLRLGRRWGSNLILCKTHILCTWLSKEARQMIDEGKIQVKSVSCNLQQNVVKDQQENPEKEKRRIAQKKERRATLILGY